MMTRAQARAQRRALMKDIARADLKKKREHLAALRQAIRDSREARKRALAHAVVRCRTARVEARAKAAALRARALDELKRAIELERAAARSHCETARAAAATERSRLARARAELRAEQQFRREMRRIERSAKERHAELAKTSSPRERAQESDDAVRANIPPELVYLFERVKRRIKGSPRMSRTEAFLHYAEEHPSEVLEALEDKTEATIRELEARERELAKRARKPMTRAELAAMVPF
jgi:hypothetical protein